MAIKVESLMKAARSAEKAGQYPAAQHAYLSVLAAYPGNPRARASLADLERRLGPVYAALSPPPTELARLVALLEANQPGTALTAITELLPSFPTAYFLHNLAGAAHEALGDPARAAQSYQAALALKPDYADGHYNLGNAQAALGDPAAAEAAYGLALVLRPDHVASHRNLGALFESWGRHDRAADAYRRAAEIDPGDTEAWLGLGHALLALRQYPDAAAAFARVLAAQPHDDWVRSLMLHQQAMACDWSDFPETALLERLGTGDRFVAPFALLGYDDDPARQRLRAEIYAAANFAPVPDLDMAENGEPAARIRIGYVSTDFYDHPVMRLLAGVLREHDRDRFEVIAYSCGPPRNDCLRELAIRSVDRFVDLGALDDAAAIAAVRADKLDIAVHLNGYTGTGRTPLFARKLAPVQINYLGYPGTLGAPFMDYIVADRTVVPPGQRDAISESVIWLPHCFQPNDDAREIAEGPMNRTEFGLPDSGFVFCTFNAAHKIKPAEWDVWMRLLQTVEGSVLWMAHTNSWARANLAREAAARGVDPARLIYATKVDYAEHLARHRLADLFLDTFAYNAHTTASDALWAGLPLLTRIGASYPARVAASLLRAMDLGELVTESVQDYEALALSLARDPARLSALKDRLAAARASTPLFDTRTYTRALEAGFAAAFTRYREGLPPADIALGA